MQLAVQLRELGERIGPRRRHGSEDESRGGRLERVERGSGQLVGAAVASVSADRRSIGMPVGGGSQRAQPSRKVGDRGGETSGGFRRLHAGIGHRTDRVGRVPHEWDGIDDR